MIIHHLLVLSFSLLDSLDQGLNHLPLLQVSFSLGLFKCAFFIPDLINGKLVGNSVLFNLLLEFLGLTLHRRGLVVRHVDRPENIWFSRGANLGLSDAMTSLHTLVFENIAQLLLLSKFAVGLRGVGLQLLRGFSLLKVDMLLNTVGSRQDVLDLLS